MNKRTLRNSTAILPAGKILFNKSKVSIEEVAEQWNDGTIVVCLKENGHFHFIAGASGSYFNIGDMRDFHHDQTGARIGSWKIVNQVHFKKVDGKLELEYTKEPADANMQRRAPLHVFK